jgi:(1->4)-alpha-D-glucan 1-alpha-D-glucosylmutase
MGLRAAHGQRSVCEVRIPLSTYRFQLAANFTFQDAAGAVEYVRELGVDWLYLSPVLQAEAGSSHGYDVVDHSAIDAERGGRAGFEILVRRARSLGLGVLVDIVPNHVGVGSPEANPWWWDVLTYGRSSRHAAAFDVDWQFGSDKIRIPVLADDSLEDVRVECGELRYFDHRYPLAPGSADDGADAATVHERQHYQLINWRRGDTDLNFRRFFAVSTLAGIRVEDESVFTASHSEIARWFGDTCDENGVTTHSVTVDGIRVDHPDGLLNPADYLGRLAELTGDSYVIVEKILEGSEQLPRGWAASGTTGYDALADFDRILVDPGGEAVLSELEDELAEDGVGPDAAAKFASLVHQSKRAVADTILRSEVLRLSRDIRNDDNWHGGADETRIADAVAELLAWFPVYRSYLPVGAEHLSEASAAARTSRPDLATTMDEVLPILTNPTAQAALRFQQTSGAVMAKGVEDSAFYRFNRLTSLNEVGADPAEFSITVNEFHSRQQARQRDWPLSMTTLSTHDTKRGEDTRARISVISELPGEWRRTIRRLRELVTIGDGPLENLLWQAIVGSWPAGRERLHAYAEKAAREAGNSTSWNTPDEGFERNLHALVDSAFDDSAVVDALVGFLGMSQRAGWSNGLALKLLQLTAPGVPDVYQGSELWETSLVDPDNRRPVEYDARRAMLRKLDDGELPPVDEKGAAKLLVTSRALRLRRDRPELFSDYTPLVAFGSAAEHAIAFDRGGAISLATRLSVGLTRHGGWANTRINTSYSRLRDEITGREYNGPLILLSEALSLYPVALLVDMTRHPEGKHGSQAV